MTADQPMTAAEFAECLAALGWSARYVARETTRQQTQVVRWQSGKSPIPSNVAAWLRALRDFRRAHPSPREIAERGQGAERRRTCDLADAD
jgi:hypothetical protein